MFDKRALHHVDEFVVAAGVGRPEKESRIDKKTKRVFDDSLNHFAVRKLHLNPDPGKDRFFRVETNGVAIRSPWKSFTKKRR